MKLLKNKNGIVDLDSWRVKGAPKSEIHWREGRSAMSLAEYILAAYPALPKELEEIFSDFVPSETEFEWEVEKKTLLPGTGEGRNHDAVLYCDQFVAAIEAKVDEPLGKTVGKEMERASVNKLNRISSLLSMLFQGGFSEYQGLSYQLLTASAGAILEAQARGVKTAFLLVLVFKTGRETDPDKLVANSEAIQRFYEAFGKIEENGLKVIPNQTDVKLYLKEIVI